jgi:hypothetical protein
MIEQDDYKDNIERPYVEQLEYEEQEAKESQSE